MNAFTLNTTPRLVSAWGVARNLGALVKGLIGPNVLFVTDPRKRRVRLEREAIASRELRSFAVAVFDGVEADPSLETVLKATEMARSAGCGAVVALGSGSSMEVDKLVALLAGPAEVIDDVWGVENAHGPRLPLVLIATTAGTGSDVTPVMTVPGAEKRRVTSPILLPHIALLAREAMKQARHLVNTPRTVTEDDALAIYRAAW